MSSSGDSRSLVRKCQCEILSHRLMIQSGIRTINEMKEEILIHERAIKVLEANLEMLLKDETNTKNTDGEIDIHPNTSSYSPS